MSLYNPVPYPKDTPVCFAHCGHGCVGVIESHSVTSAGIVYVVTLDGGTGAAYGVKHESITLREVRNGS